MLSDLVSAKFEENLAMAQEDYPDRTFNDHVRMANEWTCEYLAGMSSRIAENRLASHQEAICQHTDPSRNRLMGIE